METVSFEMVMDISSGFFMRLVCLLLVLMVLLLPAVELPPFLDDLGMDRPLRRASAAAAADCPPVVFWPRRFSSSCAIWVANLAFKNMMVLCFGLGAYGSMNKKWKVLVGFQQQSADWK